MRETEQLQTELLALRSVNQQLREDYATLLAEKQGLQDQLTTLQAQLAEQQCQIALLTKAASPVKPPRHKKEPKAERTKRDPQHNAVRRCEPVSQPQIVEHRLSCCPDCGMKLHRYKFSHRHQVIELPPPPLVSIIEHEIYKGYCYHCEKWCSAQPQLQGEVVGQSRLGPRLTATIGYLRTTQQLPIRRITNYLAVMHCLRLSVGGVDKLLKRLIKQGSSQLADILAQIRQSPVIHADETGWREDGKNGYAWTLATPQGLRYYERDASRAGVVLLRLLGDFKGIVESDFYGGYNKYSGRHQRCWVHLLRLMKKVAEKEGGKQELVNKWLKQLRDLYKRGKEVAASAADETEREQQYQALMDAVVKLARPYAQQKGHPLRATSTLLMRHRDELFEYVRVAGLAADNNLAERSIRPLTVARKVSGGTRSPTGSAVRMGLQSLFGTWAAQGQEPLDACLTMLGVAPKTRVPQL
jgi:transposase